MSNAETHVLRILAAREAAGLGSLIEDFDAGLIVRLAKKGHVDVTGNYVSISVNAHASEVWL